MGEVVHRATSWQGPVAANKTEDNWGGGGGGAQLKHVGLLSLHLSVHTWSQISLTLSLVPVGTYQQISHYLHV